ncbi:MAG: hypothetical protein ACYTF4_18265, partial [Planctomycetota bacterium]
MWLSVTLCLLCAAGGATKPVDDELGICRQGMAHLGDGEPQAPTALALEDTDVLHYVLDIDVVPAFNWLGGNNTITVRSLVNRLTKFQIRLRENFDITSVLVDGAPATWQRLTVHTIEIDLGQSYNIGEEFEVRIAYG